MHLDSGWSESTYPTLKDMAGLAGLWLLASSTEEEARRRRNSGVGHVPAPPRPVRGSALLAFVASPASVSSHRARDAPGGALMDKSGRYAAAPAEPTGVRTPVSCPHSPKGCTPACQHAVGSGAVALS